MSELRMAAGYPQSEGYVYHGNLLEDGTFDGLTDVSRIKVHFQQAASSSAGCNRYVMLSPQVNKFETWRSLSICS